MFTDELGLNPSKFEEYFTIIPYLRNVYKINKKNPVVLGNKELSKQFNESMHTPSQEFKINNVRKFYFNPNTLSKKQLKMNEYLNTIKNTTKNSKKISASSGSGSDSDSDSDSGKVKKKSPVISQLPSATEEDKEMDRLEEEKHKFVHESENNNLRQLSYDKKYVLLDDRISNFMGIYVIAVNNVPIRSEYNFLNTLENWKGDVTFDKKSDIWDLLQMYQKTNLMIENVYRQFYEYCHAYSPKKISNMPDALSDDIFSKTKEPPKYNNVLLSSIVETFLSIGFEHVNIIDATCREIHDAREPERVNFITRQNSDEEVTEYEDWKKDANVMGTGARRNRTRNHRNMRERLRNKKRRSKRK